MTTATTFRKQSPAPLAFDKALGLCFGWFCFSKQGGEPYVDAHGDHFPDDELVKAVDGLMAKPAAEREINVEHAGGARGSIATAQALTEDVAKALKVDTGGTYGVIGSFRPDAELLKSILAGEAFCLSIEGKAYDVETIAKSEDGAAAGATRIMRKVELTKLAVVKAGAHAGASVALIKSARAAVVAVASIAKDLAGAKKALKAAIARHARHLDGSEATDDESQMKMMADMQAALSEMEDVAKAARIAKATPALTSLEAGHQHLIHDIDEACGYTSHEADPGMPGCSHSHPWARGDGGALTIGAANGHKHTLAIVPTSTETAMPTADDTAKSLAADLAKSQARLTTLLGLPADQLAFAKRLDGAGLAAFLDAPAADRAAKATPIHKSERTGRTYYAGDEALVEVVKDADATAIELAKSREQTEAVTFEKRAREELGNTYGKPEMHVAVLKAAEGKPTTDAEKALVREWHKAVNGAYATVFTAPGVRVNKDAEPNGPQAELDRIAADLQKANPSWAFAKAKDAALDTPRGRQLYAEIERAKRAPATA